MRKFVRSDQQQDGRYSVGGASTIVGGKLKWWERRVLPKSPTDVVYTITSKFQHRPDLLAHELYGNSALMWLILQYNNINDVFVEFNTGNTLLLPTKSRVIGELLSKT